MSKQKEQMMSVRILPNTTSNPPGKLADAEVVFEADAGPLNGLKLIGFAVWERRTGGRNVTVPARQYSVNGERRSFALLRPVNGDATAQEAIRDAILDAYTRAFRRRSTSTRTSSMHRIARRLRPWNASCSQVFPNRRISSRTP